MSTHRPRRIDRETAERLLRGDPEVLHEVGPIAARLGAARAAAFPDELIGERAALAAFRAAQLKPVPQPGRPSMLKTALAKLLTVKAAAVVSGLSLGGVALAAGTGVMPNPLSPSPASHATATPTAASAHTGGHGAAHPSPSLVGLCRAYAAEATNNPGKAADSPAFAALVTAARGAENVEEYCKTVTRVSPGATPGSPGSAGRPADLPAPPVTGASANPPAGGAPTAVPTGAPSPRR